MLKEFKERKGHGYNCNLQESCFWTETSTFWHKGNIIPNYYDFQVNTNLYYYKRDKEKYDLVWNILKNMKIYNTILGTNDSSINLSNIKILYYKSTLKLKEINKKWIESVENLD